jgi:CO/xanthine dehydrogenase FAD-binding subunit
MRSYVPDFELRSAASLAEVVTLLASAPGEWRPFAGGTDLMVTLEAGTLQHTRFVSLWGLRELRGITADSQDVWIGALTTYSDIREDAHIREEFPLLVHAASETGGIATQNRGTIGGNIANGSPAADTPPALLVYDAELELMSAAGTRRVAYADFHQGYKKMDLRPDELITRVRIPRGRHGWIESYRKVGTRKAQAISKVCFAGAARLDGGRIADVRLALGSVAPTVVRCRHAEAQMSGRRPGDAIDGSVDALAQDIAPIDDIRSTAAYRLRVAGNLLQDFLQRLDA